MKSSEKYSNIKKTLSHSRFATYEKCTQNTEQALELYQWNLHISSAFFECLAVCEVVIRNAVAKAIKQVYGDDWAWNSTFITSLPKGTMQKTLGEVHQKYTSIDKLIPQLPLYFWQNFFTARFDKRIWQTELTLTLPNANHEDLAQLRKEMFEDLQKIRDLRNRIAHHEPIFNRNLKSDYKQIIKIISYCCPESASWVQSWQKIDACLAQKPEMK